MKILVAGNPDYGLSQSIAKSQLDLDFCSRTYGNWDLTQYQMQIDFAEKSLDYDVVISVSCLWKHHQTNLVQEVARKWIEHKKDGYLIVVGSSADTPVKGTAWMYPAEKKALRAYCRQLSQISAGENESSIKVTYISPGNMHTPKQDKKMPNTPKLDTDYVADVIKWLINQPKDVNISEICLDKVIKLSSENK